VVLPYTTKFPEVFKVRGMDSHALRAEGKLTGSMVLTRDTRNDGDLSISGVRKVISGDRLAG